jgi:ABC-type cobalamin/Fe3+-siderophores transport system ATPase subunit
MRTFVQTFRGHLSAHGSASDDETVWKLLSRLQILTFDFTAVGSSSEELVTERCARALPPADASRASALWGNLVELSIKIAANGGDRNRDRLVADLTGLSFRLAGSQFAISARAALAEASRHALADIDDRIANISLARQERVDAVRAALDVGRYVEIRGEAGVGKSAVLKCIGERLAHESQVVVLSPGRVTKRGWFELRKALDFTGTARELLVDMAADGGAVLLIDSLDTFDDEERRTVVDLVRESASVSGMSVVVTARRDFAIEEENWLPAEALDRLGRAPQISIGELSESEIAELIAEVPEMQPLLAPNHPAREVTRNLYRLSRFWNRDTSEALPRTEVEMMRQWWRRADGRMDDGHRDRARLLVSLGEQVIDMNSPLDVSEHPDTAIRALTRSGSLSDLDNDRVSFRHDVLREWAVACLCLDDGERIKRFPLSMLAQTPFARAIELVARARLEQAEGHDHWLTLLRNVSAPSTHGSWRRAVLLATLRSEAAPAILELIKYELLTNKAALLREILRMTMAVEIEPAAPKWVAAGIDSRIVPSDLKMPSGPSWHRLILWIVENLDALPADAVPDVAELFSQWST